MDLPGHGLSRPADDPASTYVFPGYADIVVAVAEQLGLLDAVFVGWSLGGNTLLEASDRLSQAAGLMIIGTAPISFPPALAEASLPHPAVALNFQADLNEEEIAALARSMFRPGIAEIPESFLADIRRTDGRIRQVLGTSLQTEGYKDEVAAVARLSTPLAVVYGEQEQLINRNYAGNLTMPSLWRGELQLIPDAGHTPHWEQPAVFNRLLEDFVKETAT